MALAASGTTVFAYKKGNYTDPAGISASSYAADETGCVYEIIRVIGGKPLFFADHMARFERSRELAGISGSPALTRAAARDMLTAVVRSNGLTDCNVKIALLPDAEHSLYIYISPHYYPTPDEMRHGVPVTLARIERRNPNAKQLDTDYKRRVTELIAEKGVFEVLLVDRDLNITEGSRSNVFFIKGGMVFTAPENMVLKGITRDYVIKACKNAGAQLICEPVGVNNIGETDSAFITGTSIKVLPVSDIDGIKPDPSNKLLRSIAAEFDKLIAKNLKDK